MDFAQPIQQTPNLKNNDRCGLKFSIKNILVATAAFIVLIVIWTWISSPMLISVTGMGEVSVAPTNATLSFTLSSNDTNSATAIAAVNSKVDFLKQLIKNTGVPEEDIVETQVNVVPAASIALGSTGYQASISMAVKTSHVNSVSTLISTLYDNGAVFVSQPTLGVEDSKALEQKAF
ncbi:SIMPL domain-containing protein, partial [Patescibacteria group bacterium]|nr:SIMPL domain-containing protein [Patescibacteria group bacterium]